jgi:hypothetical protein
VIRGKTAMRHRPLQQTRIFEVVLKANLQLTEIVVQTFSPTVNLKSGNFNGCGFVKEKGSVE